MLGQHFIAHQWITGSGSEFVSKNPATGAVIWRGKEAASEEVHKAVQAAKHAFPLWSGLALDQRQEILENFQKQLEIHHQELAEIISKENGKPLWEAYNEVTGMIHKIPISIAAYQDRCETRVQAAEGATSITRHRPHGVVAVIAPFNFPAHMPNAHIIPALLAGNTVVLKPSEETPLVSETILGYWQNALLPEGVINLIQGTRRAGQLLTEHPDLQGVFFTGSYRTGQALSQLYAGRPGKMLALEMGGNNPLVVHALTEEDIEAAVYHTLQSAYLTSGQRCTCARRLIVTDDKTGRQFVQALILAIQKIKVGPYTERPEPFMGPLISEQAGQRVLSSYEDLVKQGAKELVAMRKLTDITSFLSPSLIDVTQLKSRVDEEIFGPLLQLSFVPHFAAALEEANRTQYGLVAGLLCPDEELYYQFLNRVKAGVMNWNRPMTGTSGRAPFGGLGKSGNHRPSAYYAADYCAYPVASLEDKQLTLPEQFLPGLSL